MQAKRLGPAQAHSRPLSLLAALAAVAWVMPAAATDSPAHACKNDKDKKVCVRAIGAVPTPVQPSIAGGKTYTNLTFAVENLGQTTTRTVSLELRLEPATVFANDAKVVDDAPMICDKPIGAYLRCTVDKLNPAQTVRMSVSAEVPPTTDPFRATADVGWEGNKARAILDIVVSGAGNTYVPRNTAGATIVSHENPDRTSDDPLYIKVILPEKDYPYTADVDIIGNGPTVPCVPGGIDPSFFVEQNPLFFLADPNTPLCRTGNEGTWAKIDIERDAVDDFVYQFEMQWDGSMISDHQQSPTVFPPTGAPAFGIFYAEDLEDGGDQTVHAFSEVCTEEPQAPCLKQVQDNQGGGDDWIATGVKQLGTEETIVASSPLAPLYALLDWLIETADGGIDPPDIMK